MPFLVYRNEENYLVLVQKVSLAGNGGPIYSLIKEKIKNQSQSDAIGWEVTEDELIEKLGFEKDGHRLIIDLKPSVQNNVSLYYLKRIFGYSYEGWTPIALQLETIFVDKIVADPKKFKEKFMPPKEEPDIVHEFLYLQGGFKEGSWNWGRSGSVNGCLLWPDAYKFFVDKITPYV